MTMPEIWKHVSECHCGFFNLAYHLRLPRLYLDAAKENVSKPYSSLFAPDWFGRRTHQTHVTGNDEKYALLLAGELSHAEQIEVLRRTVLKTALFSPDPDFLSISTKSTLGWSLLRYHAAIAQIFRTELLPMLVAPLDSCRMFHRTFKTWIEALHWLRGIAGERYKLGALRKELHLHLDIDNLEYCVHWALQCYKRRVGLPPLGAASSRRCSYVGRESRDCLTTTLEAEERVYPRAFCRNYFPAEYQDVRFLASFDPSQLFRDREVRPWPLNREARERAEVVAPERIEVLPASYAYLESIGLGSVFAQFAGKKSDGPASSRKPEGGGDVLDTEEGEARLRMLFE